MYIFTYICMYTYTRTYMYIRENVARRYEMGMRRTRATVAYLFLSRDENVTYSREKISRTRFARSLTSSSSNIPDFGIVCMAQHAHIHEQVPSFAADGTVLQLSIHAHSRSNAMRLSKDPKREMEEAQFAYCAD